MFDLIILTPGNTCTTVYSKDLVPKIDKALLDFVESPGSAGKLFSLLSDDDDLCIPRIRGSCIQGWAVRPHQPSLTQKTIQYLDKAGKAIDSESGGDSWKG